MYTALKWFWERAKHLEGSETRLKLLKEYAEETVKTKYRNYKRLRKRFAKAKSKSEIINSNCFCCERKAQARHHIIQIQHGGDNRENNIVMLCYKCHAEIHPWLNRRNIEKVKERKNKEAEYSPLWNKIREIWNTKGRPAKDRRKEIEQLLKENAQRVEDRPINMRIN